MYKFGYPLCTQKKELDTQKLIPTLVKKKKKKLVLIMACGLNAEAVFCNCLPSCQFLKARILVVSSYLKFPGIYIYNYHQYVCVCVCKEAASSCAIENYIRDHFHVGSIYT